MPKHRGNSIASSGGFIGNSSSGSIIEQNGGTEINNIGTGGIFDTLAAADQTAPVNETVIHDSEGVSERVSDRINERISVTVPVYSRTRRTTENTDVTFDPETPGHARVNSESGTTHTVDYENDNCTCPHHRIRGVRCRHMEAVDFALGRLRQSDPSEPPGRIIDTHGVELAVTERQIADIAEENARSEINRIAEDDGFFYS